MPNGLSIDLLVWARHKIFGPNYQPEDSPTVIIAIDEETYRRQPFEGLPRASWTPYIAKVLDAVLEGGARVIGQDLILPTSVEPLSEGIDREYLLFLRNAGRDKRIVLGSAHHLTKPIGPYPGHSFAVGHEENVRLVNLPLDKDGVIRRFPIAFQYTLDDGSPGFRPSFPVELALRAKDAKLKIDNAGRFQIGDVILSGRDRKSALINFEAGASGVPVYSFADLYACANTGGAPFFEDAFQDKVVLFGAVLDIEDRKMTSARFISEPEGSWFSDRCKHPVMAEIYENAIARPTVPATFIFANAVNNVLRQGQLNQLTIWSDLGLSLLVAFIAALCPLMLRPYSAVSFLVILIAIWLSLSVILLNTGTVLPFASVAIASVLAFSATLVYQLVLVDRERRRMRRAFSFYLPSTVIDRMDRENAIPKLGGETREITVLFSDVENFTRVCEGLTPSEVVRIMNIYLTAMTDTIEEHGGYVEKYVGDSITAIFGAPLSDENHALQGVTAALACRRKVRELASTLVLPAGRSLRTRIGVHTGLALVGNIGSTRRFNYTAMGDAVNVAARIESANKVYGTDILMSESSALRLKGEVTFRRLERVRVMGRAQPVVLCEPMKLARELDERSERLIAIFEAAWQRREAHDFEGVAEVLQKVESDDPPARVLRKHAETMAKDRLEKTEDPVFSLEEK